MPRFRCRFCRHDNPEGARFCNDCGSPLHLKPCPQCEAVNEDTAVVCHQCGASFGSERMPEPAMAEIGMESHGESRGAETNRDHVPESLARTYDFDGSRFDYAPRNAPSSVNRQVEPVERRSNPDEVFAEPVTMGQAPARNRGSGTRIALVLIALGVVAAAAYYQFGGEWTADRRNAATDTAPPSTASTAPAPATVAQPAAPQVVEPPAASDAEQASNAPGAAPPVAEPATSAPPQRPRARESGRNASARASGTPDDKSATQRIIARELGKFAGPADSPMRSVPASPAPPQPR